MKTLILTALILAALTAVAACGGDDDDTPTARPTPTPEVQPTAAGDDDESQIRFTLQSFAYYLNQNDFEGVCDQYAEVVLSAQSCADIEASLTGLVSSQGADRVSARLVEIREITVDGDTGTADYTMCLDVGAGEACEPYVVGLAKEGDRWKISG
jgi:ketosteroid isomerase-like protein